MRLGLIETKNQPTLALIRDTRYLPVRTIDPAASDDLGIFLATVDWHSLLHRVPDTGWLPLAGARWLPPLSRTSRIFCVGKNYADHAREMGMASGGPVAPDIFVRFPSSFSGHAAPIEFPASETSFDFEGELAVVIGKSGFAIPPDRALDHVFGYTAANDGSLRRIQKRTSQFTLGKNIDRSGGIGPTITPTSDIADPQNLRLCTHVNDKLMQDGTTADMTFPVADIIATISGLIALAPGDIILTGTPAGVGAGRTPPRFLETGDSVRIDIDGLDSLANPVRHSPNAAQ